MGNTRYYTKDNGQSFAELEYDVWGAVTSPSKLTNNDNGNFAAAVFTGHPYDTVLDIYFAEARFYDANHRQWMSVDPIKSGLNWYLYANGNPATYWDPNGWEAIIIGTDVITNVSVINGKIYADMNDVAKAYGGTAQMKRTDYNEADVTWNIPDGAGKTITATYDTGIFKINGQNVQRDYFRSTYNMLMRNDPSGRVLVDTQYFSKLICANADKNYHEVWWYGRTPNVETDENLKDIIEKINDYPKVQAHPELAWGQEKVNAVWARSAELLLKYGLDFDPRIAIAVAYAEGTGSFNTNNKKLAADKGASAELDFEEDLDGLVSNLFGKLIAYSYYKDDFEKAVVTNRKKDWKWIQDDGSIFKYFNWETPIYWLESGEITAGVYANGVGWHKLVEEYYNRQALGKPSDEKGEPGGMEAYSEYARNISPSVIEKIIGDPNFKYPEYTFSPKLDQISYDWAVETAPVGSEPVEPNDHFSIKAHS